MTDAQTIRRALMAALPHLDHNAAGHDWEDCLYCCDSVTVDLNEDIQTDGV